MERHHSLTLKTSALRHERTEVSLYYSYFCLFIKFMKSVTDEIHKAESRKGETIRSAHYPKRKEDELDKHIFNLSLSYQLSTVEKQALEWGLDFCILPKEITL